MKVESKYKIFKTASGWAGVAGTKHGICRIVFPQRTKLRAYGELDTGVPDPSECHDSPVLREAGQLLRRYFAGKAVSFDLPLDVRYYTKFQQAVWRAAAEIPYGETRSYLWVAERIGSPRAVRAVGQALGANPVPIIIPCHRVVSSSEGLGGFSGGLALKKKLLCLEAESVKLKIKKRKTKEA